MGRQETVVGTRARSGWAVLPIGMLLIVGCAVSAPLRAKEIQPGELASLAGRWEWSSWVESPGRLGPGPLKVRLAGGKLWFETTTVTGTFTLYEGPGQRVLRGEGADRGGNRPFSIQLTQRVRISPTEASGAAIDPADASGAYVLLIVE